MTGRCRLVLGHQGDVEVELVVGDQDDGEV